MKKMGVPISDFSVNNENGRVYIRSVDHHFSWGEYPLFFDAYKKYHWKFLDNEFKFRFEEGSILLENHGLFIRVENMEEFFIIDEVFIQNAYQLDVNHEYIVFDVGMNVGISSLYFSQNKNIKKVYGFEPLKETFKCALRNFGLNEKLHSKIECFNVGLGAADIKMNLHYNAEARGNVGIKNVQASTAFLSSEEIELKRGSILLRKFMQDNPGAKFIVKIDCEGSEYDILEDLVEQNILEEFDVFMIEWHNIEGYKKRLNGITQSMKDKNFIVKAIGSFSETVGMLYCFKI